MGDKKMRATEVQVPGGSTQEILEKSWKAQPPVVAQSQLLAKVSGGA
jgi:hypothetical protein